MAESKYGKYIFRDPRGKGMPPRKVEEANINLSEGLVSSIGGFNIEFNFVGHLQPHVLADPPHTHDFDEMLFFIPADPSIAPKLGGVMEIALGEEWEKHTIDTAAIICIPKGLQHCPVYTKKVDKPFYFGHCILAPKYSSSASPAQ